jgi:hypothetical protein
MPGPLRLNEVRVPFPHSTSPGTQFHPQESGGRIINAYLEPLGPAAPSEVIYRRAPGLRNFGTTTRSGFRGGIEVAGTLYTAWANNLVSFTAAGGAGTNVGATGSFSGTAKGFFARNNRVASAAPLDFQPDIVFVDPDGIMLANNNTGAFVGMTRPGAMGIPNSVCSIDGFFVFTLGNGEVWASDLNSQTINPLSFAHAENKPDGLTRGLPWVGNLYLFGPSTTEVWSNVGATPFPFQRSVVIPRGIAGPYCVAGFEDNFSRALVWVADDNTVVRLNGYTPEKISSPDLDGLIEAVADKRQLEMSTYMSRGHAFVLLSSPTWSWVFNLNNDTWAERQSYLNLRSRITGGVYAFNKWLCGDLLSGNLQEITNTVHTEIGQPFRWRLESGAVENFPVGARVGRLDCEFVTGVGKTVGDSRTRKVTACVAVGGADNRIKLTFDSGVAGLVTGEGVNIAGIGGVPNANGNWSIIVSGSNVILAGSTFAGAYTSGGVLTQLTPLDPIETDPVVEISWSDDGGQTYYAPIQRKLGRQARTRNLVSLISCTGRSGWTARRWRLDISDPVHVGFMAAYQNISPKVSDIG